MKKPTFSESQRLGGEAQAAFAAFVVRRGSVWNPTAASADFGIDGRVEVAESRQMKGVEFAVQVKGTARLTVAKDQTILIGRANTSTLRY